MGGDTKIIPPFPLGDINYFYSLKLKLLFNFTCVQLNCYKEVKKVFLAHVYFPPPFCNATVGFGRAVRWCGHT